MTDKHKDDLLNQGDDVVERLKDAANRMLDGEIMRHNLSVFATDILTILNRSAISPPVPDDVAEAVNYVKENSNYSAAIKLHPQLAKSYDKVFRAASTPSAEVMALRKALDQAIQAIEAIGIEQPAVFTEGIRPHLKRWKDALNHTEGK